MRNKMLVVIGILLFVLSQVGVNYIIYKHQNNVEIPRVQLKDVEENKKDKKSSFAIMLEQDDGSYASTSSNSFDQPGYVFNSVKSGCIDINGNKIENSLSYNDTTKAVVVSVSSTAYCYAYFDIAPNLYKVCGSNTMSNCDNSGKLSTVEGMWQSGLDGDGYRYVGTNPSNYICFGTTDKTKCTGNTDAYMYRIIGVFADSTGKKNMKLIKKEALNISYKWNDSNSDVDWGASTLKSNLNGTLFLNNTTYMPSGWSDRIASWTWNTVNTKTYESSGPNYYNAVNTQQMYLHENNKTGAPSGGVHGTLPSTKIGLMYASDYQMSLGNSALSYTGSSNYSTLKTGWMHLWNANNDIGAPLGYEWIISRYGKRMNDHYGAWEISSGGYVTYDSVTSFCSVRPVFYLNYNQVIKSGTGTISDPYILS